MLEGAGAGAVGNLDIGAGAGAGAVPLFGPRVWVCAPQLSYGFNILEVLEGCPQGI